MKVQVPDSMEDSTQLERDMFHFFNELATRNKLCSRTPSVFNELEGRDKNAHKVLLFLVSSKEYIRMLITALLFLTSSKARRMLGAALLFLTSSKVRRMLGAALLFLTSSKVRRMLGAALLFLTSSKVRRMLGTICSSKRIVTRV